MRNESGSKEAPGEMETEATLLDSLAGYLRTHEVNLKLADLLDEHTAGQVTGERKRQ